MSNGLVRFPNSEDRYRIGIEAEIGCRAAADEAHIILPPDISLEAVNALRRFAIREGHVRTKFVFADHIGAYRLAYERGLPLSDAKAQTALPLDEFEFIRNNLNGLYSAEHRHIAGASGCMARWGDVLAIRSVQAGVRREATSYRQDDRYRDHTDRLCHAYWMEERRDGRDQSDLRRFTRIYRRAAFEEIAYTEMVHNLNGALYLATELWFTQQLLRWNIETLGNAQYQWIPMAKLKVTDRHVIRGTFRTADEPAMPASPFVIA